MGRKRDYKEESEKDLGYNIICFLIKLHKVNNVS